MDFKELSVKINTALSKTLTDVKVVILKEDGAIGIFKIISDSYDGLSFPQRLTLTLTLIKNEDSSILQKFDLTFILLSKIENTNWTDLEEANQKLRDNTEKQAAKEF